MSSKGYQTHASQFTGKDPIGKPMGSRDDDWVTVGGVRYVPEAPLKAEIDRLREALAWIRDLAPDITTIEALQDHARKALAKEGK